MFNTRQSRIVTQSLPATTYPDTFTVKPGRIIRPRGQAQYACDLRLPGCQITTSACSSGNNNLQNCPCLAGTKLIDLTLQDFLRRTGYCQAPTAKRQTFQVPDEFKRLAVFDSKGFKDPISVKQAAVAYRNHLLLSAIYQYRFLPINIHLVNWRHGRYRGVFMAWLKKCSGPSCRKMTCGHMVQISVQDDRYARFLSLANNRRP